MSDRNGRRARARRDDRAPALFQTIPRRAGPEHNRPRRLDRSGAGRGGRANRAGGRASLGAPYHTLAELREAAETAVDEIQARVDSVRQNGGLKQVNAEYKRYRAQQIAKAEKAMPYAKFLERFTALIVRDVAMTGRGDRVTI
jgi:hypothetical protein